MTKNSVRFQLQKGNAAEIIFVLVRYLGTVNVRTPEDVGFRIDDDMCDVVHRTCLIPPGRVRGVFGKLFDGFGSIVHVHAVSGKTVITFSNVKDARVSIERDIDGFVWIELCVGPQADKLPQLIDDIGFCIATIGVRSKPDDWTYGSPKEAIEALGNNLA